MPLLRLPWSRPLPHPPPAAAPAAPPMPIIVGAARSGTTLLRLMLDAHPHVAIPPETGFLTPVLSLRGPGAALRHTFFHVLTHYPPEASAWHDFGLPAADFWRELSAIEPFTTAAGLRCFYRAYADRFGKPRWGDKTPVYGQHMRAIEQLLPEAHFIHLIRDGRDVALSLRPLWFSPSQDIAALARAWRRQVSTARAQGQRCRHYLEVRYEALVADPPAVLRQVCAFCGLDYHPQMEHYYQRAPERLREHQSRVRANGTVLVTQAQRHAQQQLTTHPPNPRRILAWKQAMPRDEQRQFERAAGPLLEALGYEVGQR